MEDKNNVEQVGQPKKRAKRPPLRFDDHGKIITDDSFILSFIPMIKNICKKKNFSYIHYSTHDTEDLISEGVIGLIKAASSYNPSKGNFNTFAYKSVEGAISDFTRKETNSTRGGRKHRKEIDEARKSLTVKLMRDPNDDELVDELKIREMKEVKRSLTEILDREPTGEELEKELRINKKYFHKMKAAAGGRTYLSIDSESIEEEDSSRIENMVSMMGYEGSSEQESSIADRQIKEVLKEEIEKLPQIEKDIIRLFYGHGYYLREVAHMMGITDSRTSQWKALALNRLKERMAEHLGK